MTAEEILEVFSENVGLNEFVEASSVYMHPDTLRILASKYPPTKTTLHGKEILTSSRVPLGVIVTVPPARGISW